MIDLVKGLRHVQLCDVQWSIPLFATSPNLFLQKTASDASQSRSKPHWSVCLDGSGMKCRTRYPTNFQSDQCSNASEIFGSSRDCPCWTQCGGDLGPRLLKCAVEEVVVQGSCHGYPVRLVQLLEYFAIRGAFSKLQLPDNFHQEIDSDMQRPCSPDAMSLRHSATHSRLGQFLIFTLFRCKLVHSREIIKELLRRVSVWTLRPIVLHASTCDAW